MNCGKSIFCVLLLCGFAFMLRAQCPDFTDLGSSNVTCYYGTVADPMLDTGIVYGRHTLITQQGTDPRTGGLLPLLPPGESAVIKLGNENAHAKAEALIYTFTVDPDQPILILKYAVVMQDPEHDTFSQPRFTIKLLDNHNELLDSCMKYDVISGNDIPGFQSFGDIRWRPWTINGFDLSDYSGQTVKLQVTTFDCWYGGHYGYAYFTASCISNRLELSGCNGNQITLTAPSGFENYAWNNGSTAISSIYTLQDSMVVTCLVHTVTGCQCLLTGTFNQNPSAQDQTFYDTICQGQSYHNHGFVLPPQGRGGTFAFFRHYFDLINCTEAATVVLYLHVIPRYTHIYAQACEGDDYNAYGFVYHNLAPGLYTDTLNYVVGSGCDSSSILHLTVNADVPTSLVVSGPMEICGINAANYSLLNPENVTSFQWSVPGGVYLLNGNGRPTANLFFSSDAPNPSTITLTASNGCGSQSVTLPITVHPSYQYFYSDTICKGNNYSQYGFPLGVQDSAGLFIHSQMDSTLFGCDSITVLELFVADRPSVSAIPDPPVLCLGDETVIHAITPNSTVTLSSDLPIARVGDILCTDSTFVHPENWPNGKTPKAIVFYVDPTGYHGWAVGLHDDTDSCQWGTNAQWPANLNIPNLPDCPNIRTAISDIDGYQNTSLIRNYYPAAYYPAAYSVDFANGWYLPAAGQSYHLYATIPAVNNSLQLVGGTLISTNTLWTYWTSSEINFGNVWVLSSSKGLYYEAKSDSFSVRAVCSF